MTLSYSEVFGEKPTWDMLADALGPYSVEQIVDAVSRMSIGLAAAVLPWDLSVQVPLCRGLFSAESLDAVGHALDRLRAEHEGAGRRIPLLVVNEQSLLDLIKAAFLTKSLSDPSSQTSLDGVGRALLMIADLTAGQLRQLTDLTPEDPEYRSLWLSHTLANMMFTSSAFDYAGAARAYELYLDSHVALRDHASYVDLAARLERAHGLTPVAFWSVLFALASKWAGIALADLPGASIPIDSSTYFSSKFTFSSEDSTRLLSLCCSDAGALQQSVHKHYDAGDLRAFHVLPFAMTPLVSFGPRVYPVSIRLLGDKLLRGIHYAYLEPSVFSEKERDAYLSFAGYAFEDYVHRTFERMFPPLAPPLIGAYQRADTLTPPFPRKVCDGLLALGRDLAVIESKASLFSVEARSGNDPNALEKMLRRAVSDASCQLGSTVETIRQGYSDSDGFVPPSVDRFFPVIVTLEDITMTPLLHSEFLAGDKIDARLVADDVFPLQVMTISDLEHIETALGHTGRTLDSLILEKVNDPIEREDSWANFLFRRRDELQDNSKHEYLHDVFDRIANEALTFFKDHVRPDPSA